ncbi:MAG: glycoside hydrolase family 97 N-terminal domain-containing protein, partial [Bacteroidota bacterium]
MYKFLLPILAAILLSACGGATSSSQWSLTEPNGEYRLTLDLVDGQLLYHISAGEQILVDSSRLGIIRADADLSRNLRFVSASKVEQLSDAYTLKIGKQRELQDQGVAQTYTFENAGGALLEVQVKALTDGFGIRYHFPENDGAVVTVEQELTEFNFSTGGRAWLQAY